MKITVDSQRWIQGPARSRLRARINRWLIAHDPQRVRAIEAAEAELEAAMQALLNGEPDALARNELAMRRLLSV